MIDAYATTGTFADPHQLARDLAETLMKIEQVPDIPMFRQNTAAFIHELPYRAISNVEGESNYVRQVLTGTGALDRDKQRAVVRRSPTSSQPRRGPSLRRGPGPSHRSCRRGWDSAKRQPTQTRRRAPGRRAGGERDVGVMGSDVIIGHDGKPRCSWVGAVDTALARYHDEVWGTRTYHESAMFEALTLGVFEVGLSWSIVFGKRDAFRKAFHGFDIAKVAAMKGRDVDRLLQDPSIIRNRAKIEATIDNAQAMRSASPSLIALAKSYESTRTRAPRSLADLPTSTPHAESFAKQLKSQGYRFVGPTSVYAFMQNVGVINDHIHGCFRATD
jgi:DNA-3-methyladenine glycosylase I